MRKARAFSALAAMLAATAATAAFAQEAPDSERSRLLPPQPEGIAPPISIVATPSPTATARSEGPEFVSVDALVASVGQCREIVSPAYDVDTSPIATGWGHTTPQRSGSAARSYETVQYIRGGMSIVLMDFGDFVICRGAGFIEQSGSVDVVRSEILDNYNAVPLPDAPALAPFAQQLAQNMPGIDPRNVLIMGEYQIEIATQSVTAQQHGQSGVPDLTLVMVTTNPLPPRFRNATGATAADNHTDGANL